MATGGPSEGCDKLEAQPIDAQSGTIVDSKVTTVWELRNGVLWVQQTKEGKDPMEWREITSESGPYQRQILKALTERRFTQVSVEGDIFKGVSPEAASAAMTQADEAIKQTGEVADAMEATSQAVRVVSEAARTMEERDRKMDERMKALDESIKNIRKDQEAAAKTLKEIQTAHDQTVEGHKQGEARADAGASRKRAEAELERAKSELAAAKHEADLSGQQREARKEEDLAIAKAEAEIEKLEAEQRRLEAEAKKVEAEAKLEVKKREADRDIADADFAKGMSQTTNEKQAKALAEAREATRKVERSTEVADSAVDAQKQAAADLAAAEGAADVQRVAVAAETDAQVQREGARRAVENSDHSARLQREAEAEQAKRTKDAADKDAAHALAEKDDAEQARKAAFEHAEDTRRAVEPHKKTAAEEGAMGEAEQAREKRLKAETGRVNAEYTLHLREAGRDGAALTAATAHETLRVTQRATDLKEEAHPLNMEKAKEAAKIELESTKRQGAIQARSEQNELAATERAGETKKVVDLAAGKADLEIEEERRAKAEEARRAHELAAGRSVIELKKSVRGDRVEDLRHQVAEIQAQQALDAERRAPKPSVLELTNQLYDMLEDARTGKVQLRDMDQLRGACRSAAQNADERITNDEIEKALTNALDRFRSMHGDPAILFQAGREISPESAGRPQLSGSLRLGGRDVRWRVIDGRLAVQVGEESGYRWLDSRTAEWDAYMGNRISETDADGNTSYRYDSPLFRNIQEAAAARQMNIEIDPARDQRLPLVAQTIGGVGRNDSTDRLRRLNAEQRNRRVRAVRGLILEGMRQSEGANRNREQLFNYVWANRDQSPELDGLGRGELRSLFTRAYNELRDSTYSLDNRRRRYAAEEQRGLLGRAWDQIPGVRNYRINKQAQNDHKQFEQMTEIIRNRRAEGWDDESINQALSDRFGENNNLITEAFLNADRQELLEQGETPLTVLEGGRSGDIVDNLFQQFGVADEKEQADLKRQMTRVGVAVLGGAALWRAGSRLGKHIDVGLKSIADGGPSWAKNLGTMAKTPLYMMKDAWNVWKWGYKNSLISKLKPNGFKDEKKLLPKIYKNIWPAMKHVPWVLAGTVVGLPSAIIAGPISGAVKGLAYNPKEAKAHFENVKGKVNRHTLWTVCSRYNVPYEFMNRIEDAADMEKAIHAAREGFHALGLSDREIMRYYDWGEKDNLYADQNLTGIAGMAAELGIQLQKAWKDRKYAGRSRKEVKRIAAALMTNNKAGANPEEEEKSDLSIDSFVQRFDLLKWSNLATELGDTAYEAAHAMAVRRHPNASSGYQHFYAITRYLPDSDVSSVVGAVLGALGIEGSQGELARQIIVRARSAMQDQRISRAIGQDHARQKVEEQARTRRERNSAPTPQPAPAPAADGGEAANGDGGAAAAA